MRSNVTPEAVVCGMESLLSGPLRMLYSGRGKWTLRLHNAVQSDAIDRSDYSLQKA